MMSVVKRLVPLRRSKGPGKLSLPAFPTPRHHASNTNKGYMSYIPNWPPNGCRGVLTAQGSKVKPVDGSEPPRTTRARDEATQKVSSSWCIWCPIEGIQHPQSSYLSPEWEVSITSLHVGWHCVVPIFYVDYLRKTRETIRSGFDGGGGISSCLIL
jgi:hypothetical protein